jgi:hypothetical protein
MSIIEELVERYATSPWDWLALSLNPSISFEFIQSHRNYPWVISAVSRNISITESIVRNYLEFPWSYRDLCANPNISFEFVIEFMIKSTSTIDINWNSLSSNPAITLNIIQQYSNYPWSDRYLSANPNITTNYILNEGSSRNWFMPYVSANRGITERDIYKNTLEWDYLNLGSNPNLPSKYVNDNIQKTWNMYSVSSNSNITITDIESFHRINWDPFGLSFNPNITYDYVNAHPNIKWSKPLLLSNKSIDFNTIIDNYEYFNIPQMETYMCGNPTINVNWIKKNMKYIDWKRLSRNQFSNMPALA